MEDKKTCCFTGHRPNRLPWMNDWNDLRTKALQNALWQRILSSRAQGYTRFLSGMALGVDLMCAELVLALAQQDPEVQLVPVLPYPRQAAGWRKREQVRYQAILKACSQDIVIVSPAYSKSCFYHRNRYLVDHSSRIIGVYDGVPKGGTHQTLEYAKEKGLEIELLMPG